MGRGKSSSTPKKGGVCVWCGGRGGNVLVMLKGGSASFEFVLTLDTQVLAMLKAERNMILHFQKGASSL